MKKFYYLSVVNNGFMFGTLCTDIEAKNIDEATMIAKTQCKENLETLLEVCEMKSI